MRDHTNHSLRVCSLFIFIFLETFTSHDMFESGSYARDHSKIPIIFCEKSIMKVFFSHEEKKTPLRIV